MHDPISDELALRRLVRSLANCTHSVVLRCCHHFWIPTRVRTLSCDSLRQDQTKKPPVFIASRSFSFDTRREKPPIPTAAKTKTTTTTTTDRTGVKQRAMTFAKCIGGESERVFASPTAREMPPGRLKMRQFLGWTRGSGSNNKSEPASPQQQQEGPSQQQQHSPAARDSKPTTMVSSLSLAPSKSICEKNQEESETKDSNNNNNNRINDDQPEEAVESSEASGLKVNEEGEQEFATPPPPSVIYRKGEKSFLDFHQHYAITRHLGEGSYSTVKQVTHRKKGGFYACKIVDKAALSAVDRAALSQEVHVLSRVSHDNIMRLHEVIEDDSKCYLVTELAEHGDLFDKIVKQGKFPQREAQKVVAALAEALYYCHSKNIIHRDIKPENVLLSGDNVKLCDFGFAKQLSDFNEQSVDSCGTPGYAAPEILDGKPYGVEVDVFSLGVVTYIMLCGYPPFPMKLSQLRTHRFNVRFPSKDWGYIDPTVKELVSASFLEIRMLDVLSVTSPC